MFLRSADFAVNSDTGAIATIVPDKDKVILYPQLTTQGKTDAAIEAKVGRNTVSIIFKKLDDKGVFAVIGQGSQEMTVLDGKTLAVLKTIRLNVDSPRGAVCSRDPNDPYVYFCGGGGHDCRLAAVNLRSLVDEGVVINDSVASASISADGKMCYR